MTALAVGMNTQQRAPSFQVASIKPNKSDPAAASSRRTSR